MYTSFDFGSRLKLEAEMRTVRVAFSVVAISAAFFDQASPRAFVFPAVGSPPSRSGHVTVAPELRRRSFPRRDAQPVAIAPATDRRCASGACAQGAYAAACVAA